MKRLAFALAFVFALPCLAAAPALAMPAVDGTFAVTGVETNSKIVAGPDGNMWVTIENGEYVVARITPAGAVQEFKLEGKIAQVKGIAVGPESKLWVTGVNKVASFSPDDPERTAAATTITSIAGPSPIVASPDGQMWVATLNTVLHFDPANPAGKVEISVGELSPNDIDVAGSLIAVGDGGKPRIVTVTTGGATNEIPVGKEGKVMGVAGGPGGQIAFSNPLATPEEVGLVAPPDPPQTQELLGDPFGVAFGADQAYWIVQFAQGALTRMTTTGEKTSLEGLPKEAPRQIASGPGNTLWVTLDKKEGVTAEGVARISGLEPPVEPINGVVPQTRIMPQTRIKKGPKKKVRTTHKRAKVKFRFTSTVASSKFQCALIRLRNGKKQPKPAYKSCKSPRTYNLKPGRYRFRVRAVASGQVDPTPASRGFRVVHVAKHHSKRHKR